MGYRCSSLVMSRKTLMQAFYKKNKGRSKPAFIKPSTSSSPYWFLFIYIPLTFWFLLYPCQGLKS